MNLRVHTPRDASYRLATTLLDADRYPAERLVLVYHERWQHESAYYAPRHTIGAGRVLCSMDPKGVEQEMWAMLTCYQVLRRVMVEAAESRPGTDPDPCGFTIALQAVRDPLIGAQGILGQSVGEIGRRVLSALATARPSNRRRTPLRDLRKRRLPGLGGTSVDHVWLSWC